MLWLVGWGCVCVEVGGAQGVTGPQRPRPAPPAVKAARAPAQGRQHSGLCSGAATGGERTARPIRAGAAPWPPAPRMGAARAPLLESPPGQGREGQAGTSVVSRGPAGWAGAVPGPDANTARIPGMWRCRVTATTAWGTHGAAPGLRPKGRQPPSPRPGCTHPRITQARGSRSVRDLPVRGLLARLLLVPTEPVVRGRGVQAQDLSLLLDSEGERGDGGADEKPAGEATLPGPQRQPARPRDGARPEPGGQAGAAQVLGRQVLGGGAPASAGPGGLGAGVQTQAPPARQVLPAEGRSCKASAGGTRNAPSRDRALGQTHPRSVP